MADEVNAKLGNSYGPTSPQSRAIGAGLNLSDGAWDANLYRVPDYFIYIYTISDREFIVSQPPLFPRLIMRPKKKGERYSLLLKIPHPFQQIDREGAIGDLMVRGHRAEQVAQSLCNPNNITLDQDAIPPEQTVLGLGQDLNAQGVFWSRNEPPTEAEIMAAERRRERYYRSLIERARTLEISNPRELENVLHQDYHMAAEFFGVETTWHKHMVKYETCPNCGEMVKPGVAYHKNSMGIVCIIDEARAKKAGVTTATVSTGGRD
jgi:hypothetical protein